MPDHDTSFGYPPGFEIGYDQITASVNIASTTEASGTTIIAGSTYTFDGGPVIAEFFCPLLQLGSTASMYVVFSLFAGATQIGELAWSRAVTGSSNNYLAVIGKLRFTPSAGLHTYSVTAFASNATGPPSAGAGAGGTGVVVPAYLRLTKV